MKINKDFSRQDKIIGGLSFVIVLGAILFWIKKS